ncbi:MAG TPA: hypothetical protein VEL28_13045 [Candidatus Binatia bacterium]|nr:hypothetical protein [Candidatus Binatia bacterium]
MNFELDIYRLVTDPEYQRDALLRLRDALARCASRPGLLNVRHVAEDGELACADCSLPYSDPGWCDLVIPDEAWAKISMRGSVLCANCMSRRAIEAGVRCTAEFRSGPFVSKTRDEADANGFARGYALREHENLRLKLRLVECQEASTRDVLARREAERELQRLRSALAESAKPAVIGPCRYPYPIGTVDVLEKGFLVTVFGESSPHAVARVPIPMLLFCPRCGLQHVDGPQPEKNWTNPPHRSHECQGCGYIWRPSDVCTDGVLAIATKGKADQPAAPLRQPRAYS